MPKQKKIDPKVYCIKSTNSKMIYVGSCSNYLSVRYQQHKYYWNLWASGNTSHNYSSFLVFNDDNDAVAEVLEYCEKDQMKQLESQYIKKFKEEGYDVVNIIDSVVDVERRNERMRKYYHRDPSKYNLKSQSYYYLNRDKILEKRRKKYLEQKEVKEL